MLCSSSSLSAVRVVSSAYLRLLIFLPVILIPACASSIPVFLMIWIWICIWIIKKPKEFQKNIYFCIIDYAKAFDCMDHHKLWKILKEMGIPDHLTCFLRNLYAGQEATVRTGHGTDWFQIGKGVVKAVYCRPAYLTYI